MSKIYQNSTYEINKLCNIGHFIFQVKLKDKFVHPKTKKHSLCYSIVYRHLERTLTQAEVNKVHKEIEEAATKAFNIVIR